MLVRVLLKTELVRATNLALGLKSVAAKFGVCRWANSNLAPRLRFVALSTTNSPVINFQALPVAMRRRSRSMLASMHSK